MHHGYHARRRDRDDKRKVTFPEAKRLLRRLGDLARPERRTGELTSRLSSDTTVLQNTVSVNISVALRNLAAAVGGVAMLLYTSPVLTVLMLAVVPPLLVAVAIFSRRIRKLSRDMQDALA